MWMAISLGFLGSLGHCVGMCSAVLLLFQSQPEIGKSRRNWFLLHAGRIFTYSLLGLIAGMLGQRINSALPGMRLVQGGVALLTALLAIYLSLALIGRAAPPDRFLAVGVRRWRVAMQTLLKGGGKQFAVFPLIAGVLWGLLPCGLVLTALFTAAVSATALNGALIMLVFGLATLPALLGVHWLSSHQLKTSIPRGLAAAALLVFAAQFTLRGLASWGWVEHLMLGRVMLW